MKKYPEFFNDKGNVRPAARSEAKADGLAMAHDALASLDVSVDSNGSFLVPIGTAGDGTTIYLRLDAVVTTTVR
jgi:hypothetical protein